jgi:hypothetical protein
MATIVKKIKDTIGESHDIAAKYDINEDQIDTTYLKKLTYEFNKQLALGGNGKVCIGQFPMYDSNITVNIDSTTSTTYHGTLVIATQNINATGGGSYTATVYGDATNTLAPSIKIKYVSGSNVFSVYIDLPGWSKNALHIKCVALAGTPTNIAAVIDSIPTDAKIVPTNSLTANFAAKSHTHDDRYFTETEADGRFAPKSHTHDYAASGHNHDSAYAPKSHNHDDRYFTETESDGRFAKKSHTPVKRNFT